MMNLNARKYPEKTSLRYNGNSLTYGALREASERAAGILQGWGVKKGDKVMDSDFIKGFLADKLAKYKIPRVFHIVDALPHTPTGKVMKYQLRGQYK